MDHHGHRRYRESGHLQVWTGTLSWRQKHEAHADACPATATALTGQGGSLRILGLKVCSHR